MMGRTTMGERVVNRVHEILATHQPSSVKPETMQAIEKVMADAEDRVRETA